METSLLWKPKHPEKSRLWRFIEYVLQQKGLSKLQLSMQTKNYEACYHILHDWSINEPALFWQNLCDFLQIAFDKKTDRVLNNPQTMLDARWFEGAKLNFAKLLLSKQDDHPAIISINENQQRQVLTFAELYAAVGACIAGLKEIGLQVGDRVVGVMPNTAQTIIAMLATTALGGIWSSCSSDFGAASIIDRLGQVSPRVLFISDSHQYQGKIYPAAEKIVELSAALPSVERIIVTTSTFCDLGKLSKVVLWDDFIKPGSDCEFRSLDFNHPLYIMFSSGTTGKPKCIVHGAGGTLLQHMKELALHTNLGSDDSLCFYTTCGWMMWNWSVSALALGTTLVLYEGSPTYPTKDNLLQVIAKERITVFGTSAKYLLSIDKEKIHPKKTMDFSALRCILSTGSPLLPKSFDFVYQEIKQDLQLSSISGGTDIISCFALGNPILPVYRGTLQCAGLGMALAVFNEEGKSVVESQGELVCTKPFPCMPLGFWQDEDKSLYQKAYFSRFPNVWCQGDFALKTKKNGYIIYGRSDAVLNPGGIRIGTAEIYRQVELVDEVLDCVVIAQPWEDDLRIVLFVKLHEGLQLTENTIELIKHTIRQNASARHVPAKILQVKDIPRTINGKVVELAIRQVVMGQPVNNLKSLANPEALEYFRNRAELQ